MRLAPIDWIRFKTYCFPVSPMVTTTIREAVPITMPNAVSRKRTLLVRNESMAMLTISLKSIVLRAVSTNGVVMGLFYESHVDHNEKCFHASFRVVSNRDMDHRVIGSSAGGSGCRSLKLEVLNTKY